MITRGPEAELPKPSCWKTWWDVCFGNQARFPGGRNSHKIGCFRVRSPCLYIGLMEDLRFKDISTDEFINKLDPLQWRDPTYAKRQIMGILVLSLRTASFCDSTPWFPSPASVFVSNFFVYVLFFFKKRTPLFRSCTIVGINSVMVHFN